MILMTGKMTIWSKKERDFSNSKKTSHHRLRRYTANFETFCNAFVAQSVSGFRAFCVPVIAGEVDCGQPNKKEIYRSFSRCQSAFKRPSAGSGRRVNLGGRDPSGRV